MGCHNCDLKRETPMAKFILIFSVLTSMFWSSLSSADCRKIPTKFHGKYFTGTCGYVEKDPTLDVICERQDNGVPDKFVMSFYYRFKTDFIDEGTFGFFKRISQQLYVRLAGGAVAVNDFDRTEFFEYDNLQRLTSIDINTNFIRQARQDSWKITFDSWDDLSRPTSGVFSKGKNACTSGLKRTYDEQNFLINEAYADEGCSYVAHPITGTRTFIQSVQGNLNIFSIKRSPDEGLVVDEEVEICSE